jgi:hypothetical protein
MATTTNYGWTTPDDTALVKDGASAIRTLGTSVDTTTKNLNPETTLGDLAFRSSTSNVNTRIGIGTSGQNLTVVAGAPSWAASATSVLTTTGDILYASAANTLQRLGIGTTGQNLTVAAGLPSWATASSGGMTLISTTAITAVSGIELTSIPSTYNSLRVVIRDFLPLNDNGQLLMQFNADVNARYNTAVGSVTMSSSNFGGTSMEMSSGQDNNTSTSLIVIDIPDYTNTNTIKMAISDAVTNNATTNTNFNYRRNVGFYKTATPAISQLKFFPDNGDFYANGSILLYGVK